MLWRVCSREDLRDLVILANYLFISKIRNFAAVFGGATSHEYNIWVSSSNDAVEIFFAPARPFPPPPPPPPSPPQCSRSTRRRRSQCPRRRTTAASTPGSRGGHTSTPATFRHHRPQCRIETQRPSRITSRRSSFNSRRIDRLYHLFRRWRGIGYVRLQVSVH